MDEWSPLAHNGIMTLVNLDHTVPPLAEAMRFVQMTGIFYSPSEFTEPWGIHIPPMNNCVWFHVITSGLATLEIDGEEMQAAAGDLVLVPHGTGHRGWGLEKAPTPDVFDLPQEYANEQYSVLRHGGGGARTTMVCGGISFDHPASRHLIEALPTVIHLKGSRANRADWTQAILELMDEEVRSRRPGSEAVVSRLCDIVVIKAIRSWIEDDPAAQSGWLGALRDEQIGVAIAAIHSDPARPWTVASLADEVAMSRSAFAAKFTALVGEPAMQYVTRWRMNLAADLLRTRDSTVAAVATRVGYESEAAFSRAFKRVMGASPRSARVVPTPCPKS